MTTGDPDTEAQVTNSGTNQAAILDFVIPKGETGSTPDPEFLTAYSTPAQSGTSGSSLLFDRNAATNGTSITHAQNSADVVIQQPGYYSVSFHGTVSPGANATFPLSILLYLTQNGSTVSGTGARYNFQSATEAANLAFTQIIEADTAPTTLNVVGSGGDFLYSDSTITVNKLGDL